LKPTYPPVIKKTMGNPDLLELFHRFSYIFSGGNYGKSSIPSGKHTKNYGTSAFLIGKLTINGHVQ